MAGNPGPRLLAKTYALPWFAASADAYRSGSALLTRPLQSKHNPVPVHQGELAQRLLAALRTLPEESTAGRPYKDLRLFATEASPARLAAYLADTITHLRLFATEASPARLAAYLADTITHLRRLLPAWRPKIESTPRGAAKSAAEHLADHRARVRADEEASAREWLENYLGDPDDRPAPGSRVVAQELYRECADLIEEFVDAEEEREDGGPYRVPRQRVFFAVADELIGPRRGSNGSAASTSFPPNPGK